VKKQFIYILLLSFPITLFGQVDYMPQKEVGFNIGFLVTNILRNEPPTSTLGTRNFMFTYKKKYLNNSYSRYGLSMNFGKITNGNNDPEKIFQSSFRIGYEYKFRFNRKWHINRGCDAIINYFVTDTFFNNDKTKVISAGIAPFIGIQFNINPRISLSTETGLNLFYVKQENSFDINPGFPNGFNFSGLDFRFFRPQELILSIAF